MGKGWTKTKTLLNCGPEIKTKNDDPEHCSKQSVPAYHSMFCSLFDVPVFHSAVTSTVNYLNKRCLMLTLKSIQEL